MLPFCDLYKRMCLTQFQSKNAVSKVVPVDYNLAAADPTNHPDECKCGYTGGILAFKHSIMPCVYVDGDIPVRV